MSDARLLNLGCGRRRHPAWTNADLAPLSPEVMRVDVREPLPFLDCEFDAVYSSHVLEHLAPDAARRLLREIHRVLRPEGLCRVVVPDLEGICRAYLRELDAAAHGDRAAATRHEWMVVELVDQMTRTRSGGLMLRWWHREPIPAEGFIAERMGATAREEIAKIRAKAGRVIQSDETWDALPEPPPDERARFLATGEAHRWMYDRISLAQALARAGLDDARTVAASESGIRGWGEYGLDASADGAAHKPDSLYMEARKP